jgi:hypothetical protein
MLFAIASSTMSLTLFISRAQIRAQHNQQGQLNKITTHHQRVASSSPPASAMSGKCHQNDIYVLLWKRRVKG